MRVILTACLALAAGVLVVVFLAHYRRDASRLARLNASMDAYRDRTGEYATTAQWQSGRVAAVLRGPLQPDDTQEIPVVMEPVAVPARPRLAEGAA